MDLLKFSPFRESGIYFTRFWFLTNQLSAKNFGVILLVYYRIYHRHSNVCTKCLSTVMENNWISDRL